MSWITRDGRRTACALSAAALAIGAAPAAALDLLELPWADEAPAWIADARVVRCASVGVPDARLGRLAPARLSARRRGEERGRAALHAWADAILARSGAPAHVAARLHAAIEREARVVGVRPLVEGGAVVVVEVPGAALRAAAAFRGAPW